MVSNHCPDHPSAHLATCFRLVSRPPMAIPRRRLDCLLRSLFLAICSSFCKAPYFKSWSSGQHQVVRVPCPNYYMAGKDSICHHSAKFAIIPGSRFGTHLAPSLLIADSPASDAGAGVSAVAAMLKRHLCTLSGWILLFAATTATPKAVTPQPLDFSDTCMVWRHHWTIQTAVTTSFYDAYCLY